MAQISIGIGPAMRPIDEAIQDWVQEALARTAGIAVMRIEQKAEKIAAKARRFWPVDKRDNADGVVSSEMIEWGLRLDPGLEWVEAWMTNRAPYAPFIKTKSLGGKSPLQALIRMPMWRASEQLSVELPKEFEDLSRL